MPWLRRRPTQSKIVNDHAAGHALPSAAVHTDLIVMATRSQSARARGLRTLLHQSLPAATRYGIDTEVWFRGLIADQASRNGEAARSPTKDEVHDEAIGLFLDLHADQPIELYPARRASDEDVTFWVDSRLIDRAKQMALRDGVKPARLIDAALSTYVKLRVPDELVAFRHQVQEQARKLYQMAGQRARRATRQLAKKRRA